MTSATVARPQGATLRLSARAEFAASIREHRPPRTDGSSALRVLEVLEASGRSLSERGRLVGLREPALEGAVR